MRIETEKIRECEATPALVRELMADDDKRGEYMIMMHDEDEESFVQIAVDECDKGYFDIEYREGMGTPIHHAKRWASRDEAEDAFLSELDGEHGWRSRFEWECLEGYVAPSPYWKVVNRVVIGLFICILVFIALCYLASKGYFN